jgi:hypothetical protein
MNSSNASAKSRGILAFASNTASIDYERIAGLSLQLAQHHLQVPVKVVVPPTQDQWHNFRKDVDTGEIIKWNNHSRYSAFESSPWDETIVIDADYLVLTTRLNMLWNSVSPLLLCRENRYLDTQDAALSGIDPVWATVFYFRKNSRTEMFFDTVSRIQRHWNYYRVLYGIANLSFRNDFAFAIADQILNGYTVSQHNTMPFNITTAESAVDNIELDQDWMVVRGLKTAHVLPRQDLHVMSKAWLSSPKLEMFVKAAVQ